MIAFPYKESNEIALLAIINLLQEILSPDGWMERPLNKGNQLHLVQSLGGRVGVAIILVYTVVTVQ